MREGSAGRAWRYRPGPSGDLVERRLEALFARIPPGRRDDRGAVAGGVGVEAVPLVIRIGRYHKRGIVPTSGRLSVFVNPPTDPEASVTDHQTTPLEALVTSQRRLRDVVAPLDDQAIAGPAYPKEWTVAQVLSHLGSGAGDHRGAAGGTGWRYGCEPVRPVGVGRVERQSHPEPRSTMDSLPYATLVAAFEAVSAEAPGPFRVR